MTPEITLFEPRLNGDKWIGFALLKVGEIEIYVSGQIPKKTVEDIAARLHQGGVQGPGWKGFLGDAARVITQNRALSAALDVAEAVPFLGTAVKATRTAAAIVDGLELNSPKAKDAYRKLETGAKQGDPKAKAALAKIEEAKKARYTFNLAKQGDARALTALARAFLDAKQGKPEAVTARMTFDAVAERMGPLFDDMDLGEVRTDAVSGDPAALMALQEAFLAHEPVVSGFDDVEANSQVGRALSNEDKRLMDALNASKARKRPWKRRPVAPRRTLNNPTT